MGKDVNPKVEEAVDEVAPPEVEEVTEPAPEEATIEADDYTVDKAVGRGTATERFPNTSEQFCFWLRPDYQLNPFDIVAAEHFNESKTFGLVTNVRHSTDAPTHLSNFIANDFGELLSDPNTPRQGTNVAEISVLSNTEENYMPIQNESLVWFADENGIHVGLGIDVMKNREKEQQRPVCIPAGLIRMSNGTEAVAYIDVDYALGPEGAHVNIAGISGLATKTSYIMFLIQSILQTMDRTVDGRGAREKSSDVAVILLNVKYNDLLAVDQAPDGGLEPEQHAFWERLGLNPQPFSNVTYLLPAGRDSLRDPSKANCYEPQPDLLKTKIYGYEFRDCVDKLDTMLANVPDEYGVLDVIVGEIRNGIESRRKEWESVRTWNDLLRNSPLNEWVAQPKKAPGALQARSILRFFRYMNRFVRHRTTGLFVDNRHQTWTTIKDEISRVKGGHTYVIDIAKLHDNEQMLVFGDLVRTVYDVFSGAGELGLDLGEFDEEDYEPPKKVIIFVDELNKYAPSERGKRSPILEDLLEISERGRSLGVILLSAQQFASAVHDRVIGNSSTKV